MCDLRAQALDKLASALPHAVCECDKSLEVSAVGTSSLTRAMRSLTCAALDVSVTHNGLAKPSALVPA